MIPTTRTPSRFRFAAIFVVPYMMLVSERLVSLLSPAAINSNNNKIFRVVDAAHPRRRATIRRETAAYDREITTFTEDGRLAQVEYGLEASLRGSTVGAVKVRLRSKYDDDDDDDSSSSPSRSSSCLVVCIENSSFGKMHRIDDHIWMLTAGLSGDARMLANQTRRACQNHRLRYGEGPTTKQAARYTAEFYHQLTRMGGCRPLGCTAILMGVDNTNASANNILDDNVSFAAARMFRTDPGGGYEECNFCAAGNLRDVVGKELMGLVDDFDGDNHEKVIDKNENENDKNEMDRQENEAENRERTSIKKIATTIAGKFVRLLDGNKNGKSKNGIADQQETTFDVWTIQPMKGRRGAMLATCYSDVRKDNVENIML